MRLDLLAENALHRELTALERDLREFTSAQPISGLSGVVTYQAVAGGGWDLIFTVGDDSETSTNRLTTVTVDFTGDGSQEYPNEECFAMIYANGTAPENAPNLRVDGTYAWNDDDGRFIILRDWGISQPIYWGDLFRYRWLFEFESRKAVTIYFKAIAAGTSPGSLSVSRSTT